MHHGFPPRGYRRGIGGGGRDPRMPADDYYPPEERAEPMHGGPDAYDMPDEPRAANVVDVDDVKGADIAKMRLLPWFRKIVDSIENESHTVEVAVCQTTASGQQQPIDNLTHNLDDSAEETIDQLIGMASDHMRSAEWRGAQVTYSIVVRLPNGSVKRQPFMLHVPRRGNALVDPPRSQHLPNADGIIRMFMDQNLQTTQFALEGANTGKDVLLRHIQRLEDRINELESDKRRRDHEYEILQEGNLRRQMMVDEHKAKVESQAQIVATFKGLIPVLLGLTLPPHLTAMLQGMMSGGGGGGGQGSSSELGGNQLPGGPVTSDLDLVDDFIGKLEEDQEFALKLFNLMSEKPEYGRSLAALYESSRARRDARARQQAEEAARRQNGESNGATSRAA